MRRLLDLGEKLNSIKTGSIGKSILGLYDVN